ncbi:cyclic nucleotide-binding/CBS domain-containing protein [Candidatus Undinarchaeota archaeon]
MNDRIITVKEAMTPEVKTVNTSDSLEKVSKFMVEHNIGCVVVSDGGPVGIISEADLVTTIADGQDPKKTKAKDVMTSPVVSIGPNEDVIEVSKKLSKYNIRRIPVMEGDRLMGIVTSHDLLRVAAEEESILSELVDIRLGQIMGSKKHRYLSGRCEVCTEYSDFLSDVNGKLVCQECVDAEA